MLEAALGPCFYLSIIKINYTPGKDGAYDAIICQASLSNIQTVSNTQNDLAKPKQARIQSKKMAKLTPTSPP